MNFSVILKERVEFNLFSEAVRSEVLEDLNPFHWGDYKIINSIIKQEFILYTLLYSKQIGQDYFQMDLESKHLFCQMTENFFHFLHKTDLHEIQDHFFDFNPREKTAEFLKRPSLKLDWPFMNVPQLISMGSDKRASADPLTGKSKYFVSNQFDSLLPHRGSCTASGITRESFSNLVYYQSEVFPKLKIASEDDVFSQEQNSLKRSLSRLLDIPEDTEVIFTPSGTDIEYLISFLYYWKYSRESDFLQNILTGIGEVGGGTELASKGLYFDSCLPLCSKGADVGMPVSNSLPIFDSILIKARDEETSAPILLEERFKFLKDPSKKQIIHLVDVSKTGIRQDQNISLAQGLFSEDDVIIDAAQFRSSLRRISLLLKSKSTVFISGSKFFAAPPFCGVLFVKKKLLSEAHQNFPIENFDSLNFSKFFSSGTFSREYSKFSELFCGPLNWGLLFRLKQFVSNLNEFSKLNEIIIEEIKEKWSSQLNQYFTNSKLMSLRNFENQEKSIINFSLLDKNGIPFSFEKHKSIYSKFSELNLAHIGQAVRIDNSSGVLRLALGYSDFISHKDGINERALNTMIRQDQDILEKLAKLSRSFND